MTRASSSGRSKAWTLFGWLVLGVACSRPAPAPRAPEPAPPTGEELFARGEYRAARLAFEREERGASPDEVARARFFRAVIRLAQQDAALAREELRRLESAQPTSPWPRLARLLSEELARTTVLREAMMDAGSELHLLRLRIQLLEQALEDHQEELAAQQTELQGLKDDRARLQVAVRDAEERLATQASRVRELEEALEALKNIDMQREP